MRRIVIIGSGAGGTIAANQLRGQLPEDEWEILVIDRDEQHHYQPGYLFIPFGLYSREDILQPKRLFIPPGVEFVLDEVTGVDAENRTVRTRGGSYPYDWLVVATGARLNTGEVEGMAEAWDTDIHNFYTLGGAERLRKALKYFTCGKIVLNIAELPFKCPIAPLEFLFMCDWFLTASGARQSVELELVTPLGSVFTKPIAAKALAHIAEKKRINVTPNFNIARVNSDAKTIESHDGRSVGYDLLVSIPPNFGAACLENSGLTDPMGYVTVDKNTLKSDKAERIFVLGDASNVPTSKAGSSAHYQAYTLVENLLREIDGHEPLPSYDGHATCFLEAGYDKAILLDFNYEVEPLPGKFPFPGVGPFSLLKESLANHWGKMMFRWVYWELMMRGKDLPLENQMNLAGKMRAGAACKM
ncbi:type III sulfide quinone reductase, selenoprotein subtype [Fundidesulfovibrio terrae]|uniref:type III sulfide quinone reductase, selenoprotein subtype n=1 Tax=Fundidesulfovibrio terrae TaxID=2922866 RepID=UPI001FAFF8BF|nr:FAD/NAD(P)-binding oxidoreductase [Fundidesulfovibrio terrae]